MKRSVLAGVSMVSIFILAAVFGMCLFGFAGTWRYMRGWLYLAAFFVPTLIITAAYLIKNPVLVENRVVPQETRTVQKIGQSIAGFLFVFGMLGIGGLDWRYRWSLVPQFLTVLADIMIVLGFWVVYQVFNENTFASRAVEVMVSQEVISTGLYAYVRHPMYLGASVIIFFTPLALGSWWAMISALLLCIYIGIRLLDEEALLRKELDGYEEYCKKVKYHLIPYIW